MGRGSWIVVRASNNESRITYHELTVAWGWRAEAAGVVGRGDITSWQFSAGSLQLTVIQ